MHKIKCWSLLSANQLLLIQNASAVWTSINLWNQTSKAIMLNIKLVFREITAAYHMKLAPACQKSDNKLQIKMEIQLKEHCIKTRLTFHISTETHTRKRKSKIKCTSTFLPWSHFLDSQWAEALKWCWCLTLYIPQTWIKQNILI